MMFGSNHYVPVLRYKRAEVRAVASLFEKDRDYVTPLFEIPPTAFRPRRAKGWVRRKLKPPKKVVRDTILRLKDAWGPRRLFLDLTLLHPSFTINHRAPWREFADSAKREGLNVVPVTNIRETIANRRILRTFAADQSRGACVRVNLLDLERSDFNTALKRLLSHLALGPKSIDLVVDLGEYYEASPSYEQLCSRLPALAKWRSFTVVCGAFSKDLEGYTVGEITSRKRADWVKWRDETTNGELSRKPAYGDYTIQFGCYTEPLAGGQPSASVRYADVEHWQICRGESLGREGGPGKKQYRMWARMLSKMKYFSGPKFSAGDAFIAEKANAASDPGSPADWLFAGINRHMTVAARQVLKSSVP